MKSFLIEATKPHAPFTKGQKRVFYRNAKSKADLKRESWVCNSSGVFSGYTITEVLFDKDYKTIASSEF